MKHPKLRALIARDAKESVGGLGAILDFMAAPASRESSVLAIRGINAAYGQFLFGGDFADSDVGDLFETLLAALPDEHADDLRKLFLITYFEGAAGAGREISEDLQRHLQTDAGRRGGKKAGAGRARMASDAWQSAGLRIATEYQAENPGAGQVRIAKEIARRLPAAPGVEQLKKVVARWQQQGVLRRVRTPSR